MPLSSFTTYNLTLIAPPPTQTGSSSDELVNITAMMPQPFRIYEVPGGNEIANLQQGLTIALTPPRIVIADHSGQSPPQAQMITAAKVLIDALTLAETQVESYGWNADVLMDCSGADRLLGELLSPNRIEELLGKSRTGRWAAERIEISAPAEFSDQIKIVLNPEQQSDSHGIRLLLNAHFDSTPDSSDIERQAQEFSKLSQEVLETLLQYWDEARS
ncbi:MAG: hypothetical protein OXD50_13620 [Chloroflexi bacterium]|nr:hypothetical protein [Chloroflexota bacterium]